MAVLLLTQGCFYAFDPWTTSQRTPQYVQERAVRVGSTLQVRADVTAAGVDIRSSALPQCRHAKFGAMIERQTRSGTPSFWAHGSWVLFLAGAETGFIAAAAKGGENQLQDGVLFAVGLVGMAVTSAFALLYFGSLAGDGRTFTPWFMPYSDSQTQEVRAAAASAWDGRTEPCGESVAYPSLPVGLLASFENTQRKILWRGTTSQTSLASFDGAQTIRAVAHYCGPAHVVVGQLLESRSKPSLDEGTPDAPRAVLRDATDVVVDLGGPVDVPLASIRDDWARRVATECNDARLASCVLPAEVVREHYKACEDECAAKVGVTRTLAARRACDALAQDDEDHGVCSAEYTKALAQQGVETPDLGGCVDRCAERKKAERCK